MLARTLGLIPICWLKSARCKNSILSKTCLTESAQMRGIGRNIRYKVSDPRAVVGMLAGRGKKRGVAGRRKKMRSDSIKTLNAT